MIWPEDYISPRSWIEHDLTRWSVTALYVVDLRADLLDMEKRYRRRSLQLYARVLSVVAKNGRRASLKKMTSAATLTKATGVTMMPRVKMLVAKAGNQPLPCISLPRIKSLCDT
jgi:hypothetical protein